MMGRVSNYRAFAKELEKIAFGNMAADAASLLTRLKNPAQGLRAGWKALSPAASIAEGSVAGKRLVDAIGKTQAGGKMRQLFGTGTHLLPTAAPSAGVKGIAENLSKGGWTGAGKVTKYLPVGDKGQLAVGAASTAAGLPHAIRNSREGNGGTGVGEHLMGDAGFAGGALLTAGTGLPGMMAGLALGKAGRMAGRGVDQLASRKERA